MSWKFIAAYLTPIALGGLGSFLAFLAILPTKVGERLLAHHFEAKIATLKHEQGVELGKVQAELDHIKDRGIRPNEREYQAVSGVWEGFVDAFLATKNCVTQFIFFPDLARMSEDDVKEFLRAEEFTDQSAARIAGAENRNSAYSNAIRSRLINRAGEAVFKALGLLQKQCVFVPHGLSIHFETAIQFLNEARVEQYMAQRISGGGMQKVDRSLALVGHEGTQMFEQLRDAVRDRLLRAMQEDKKADTEIKPG